MTTARGLRERIGGALLLLILLAGAILTAGYLHLRTGVFSMEGETTLAGLRDSVEIRWDAHAIPHVFATSERDALFAQGFVHASHRLWQLELLRRTARGRLAELFGEPALEADRLVRTLDLWGAARSSVSSLGPYARERLDAYVAGVNAGIDAREGPLPPEFLILGVEPGRWSPTAAAAVGKLMELDLSSWRRELARFHARQTLPEAKSALLRPRYPEWGPTTLPGSGIERDADADTAASPDGTAGAAGDAASGEGPFGRSATTSFLEGLGFTASNAWALSGRRTASGRTILANDMHLDLRAPSTWYLVGLHADEGDLAVAGLSIPGVPGVVVGYNRGVAWGFTNGMVDDMDFTVEAVNLDRSSYRTAGGWEPFAARPESIRVRGREEPVVHSVRETVRGPVVSDLLPDLGATLSALWLGRRPTRTLEGLLAMNRATTAAAFDSAVRDFEAPHQNVVFATRDGTLGYRLGGTVPVRRGWDGASPAGWEQVGDGWDGTWPSDSMPAALYPSSGDRAPTDSGDAAPGHLVSANNLQAPGLFGRLGSDYPPPFRARRIQSVLDTARGWDAERTGGLQHDTRSLLADRLGRYAVAAARRAGEDSAAALLAGWDRDVDVDSRAASIFYAWVYRLRSLVAGDEYRHTEAWGHFPILSLLEVVREARDHPWVDDVTTEEVEDLDALEERAMRDAVAATGLRRWGELHQERSAHPLGRMAWLDRLVGFDVGPYPSSGARETVRSGDARRWSSLDSTSWQPPWSADAGPSQRFVAKMGPGPPRGAFLLPTGQSGNPFDPHYRDMGRRWREGGGLVTVPLDSVGVDSVTVRRLWLAPDTPDGS